MVRGGSGVGEVRGGVSVPDFRNTAGAKACGGQHRSTHRGLKEGECSKLFVQMFVRHLFVSWALCWAPGAQR